MQNNTTNRRRGSPQKVPLLSVVVPVYNVALYLEACLESVTKQGLGSNELELIMVNDGSTDGSELIAEKWAQNHSNFFLLNQHNQGLSAARNTGIKRARGKYLIFLDSDDIVPPHAYRNMINMLEDSESDFVTGAVHRFNTKGYKSWPWGRTIDLYKKDRRHLNITNNPEYIRDGTPWNKMYRRDFFIGTGITFPEGRVYEDIATSPRYYCLAKYFDVYHAPAYYWRVNDGGISKTISLKNVNDRFWGIDLIEKFLRSSNIAKRVIDEYEFTTLDYNLRRLLLDLWKYERTGQREILDHCCKIIQRMDNKTINRTERPLRDLAHLAKDDKQNTLFNILRTRSRSRSFAETLEKTSVVQRVGRLSRHYLGMFKNKILNIRVIFKRRSKKAFFHLIIRPIVFALPIGKRTAVFSSFWGTRFAIDSGPSSICIRLSNLDPDFNCVVFASKQDYENIKNNVTALTNANSKVRVVKNDSFRFYYYLWRSKYLFNDVSFQVGIKIGGQYRFVGKRSGQIEVETTHGTPLKKMGIDSDEAIKPQDRTYFLAKSSRYDYLASTSPTIAKLFSKSHGNNPKILKTGLPQNDFLFNKYPPNYIDTIRNKYEIENDKKIVVYAPTYRYKKGSALRYLVDFNRLCNELGGGYVLVVKPHHFNHTNLLMIDFKDLTNYSSKEHKTTAAKIKLYGNIKNIPNFGQFIYAPELASKSYEDFYAPADINELMIIADVFITDYSSTMFSYTHLGKPQMFFTPDINFYDKTRGSYFDIDKVAPGIVAKNTDELIAGIKLAANKSLWDSQFGDKVKKFEKDFLAWEKGSAIDKILQEIGILDK